MRARAGYVLYSMFTRWRLRMCEKSANFARFFDKYAYTHP